MLFLKIFFFTAITSACLNLFFKKPLQISSFFLGLKSLWKIDKHEIYSFASQLNSRTANLQKDVFFFWKEREKKRKSLEMQNTLKLSDKKWGNVNFFCVRNWQGWFLSSNGQKRRPCLFQHFLFTHFDANLDILLEKWKDVECWRS